MLLPLGLIVKKRRDGKEITIERAMKKKFKELIQKMRQRCLRCLNVERPKKNIFGKIIILFSPSIC